MLNIKQTKKNEIKNSMLLKKLDGNLMDCLYVKSVKKSMTVRMGLENSVQTIVEELFVQKSVKNLVIESRKVAHV